MGSGGDRRTHPRRSRRRRGPGGRPLAAVVPRGRWRRGGGLSGAPSARTSCACADALFGAIRGRTTTEPPCTSSATTTSGAMRWRRCGAWTPCATFSPPGQSGLRWLQWAPALAQLWWPSPAAAQSRRWTLRWRRLRRASWLTEPLVPVFARAPLKVRAADSASLAKARLLTLRAKEAFGFSEVHPRWRA